MEGKKICTRGPNFSEDERAILLQLITDRKNTIENKATNKVSNVCKQKAWEEVTDIFNASVATPRTLKQLKIVYENMKRRMKIFVDEQNSEENGVHLLANREAENEVKVEQNELYGNVVKPEPVTPEHSVYQDFSDFYSATQPRRKHYAGRREKTLFELKKVNLMLKKKHYLQKLKNARLEEQILKYDLEIKQKQLLKLS